MNIQGSTDSEHAFAIFLDELSGDDASLTLYKMRIALIRTIECLEKLARDNNISESSYLNFAVTNGKEVVVARYTSDQNGEAHTLYCSEEGKYRLIDGEP